MKTNYHMRVSRPWLRDSVRCIGGNSRQKSSRLLFNRSENTVFDVPSMCQVLSFSFPHAIFLTEIELCETACVEVFTQYQLHYFRKEKARFSMTISTKEAILLFDLLNESARKILCSKIWQSFCKPRLRSLALASLLWSKTILKLAILIIELYYI